MTDMNSESVSYVNCVNNSILDVCGGGDPELFCRVVCALS
jgi:hypothetical protein